MVFLVVLILAFVLKVSGVAVFCNTYFDETKCVKDEKCVWIKSVSVTCSEQPVAADCSPADTCNTSICDYTPPVYGRCEDDPTMTCDSLTDSVVCDATAGCSWGEHQDRCIGDPNGWAEDNECRLHSYDITSNPYGTCKTTGGVVPQCVVVSEPQCVEKVAGSGKNCQLDADKTSCTGEDAAECDYVLAECGSVYQTCALDSSDPKKCDSNSIAMGCEFKEGGVGEFCSETLTPPEFLCSGIFNVIIESDCTQRVGCKFVAGVDETCTPKSMSCTHKCVVKNNGGENNTYAVYDKDNAFTIKTSLSIITLFVLVFFFLV